MTDIEIRKVRHLENISIPLDKNRRKHLILMGKNGSGKTSVLEAVVEYIQSLWGEHGTLFDRDKMMYENFLDEDSKMGRERHFFTRNSKLMERELKRLDSGITLNSTSNAVLRKNIRMGILFLHIIKLTENFKWKNIKISKK